MVAPDQTNVNAFSPALAFCSWSERSTTWSSPWMAESANGHGTLNIGAAVGCCRSCNSALASIARILSMERMD